MLDRNPHFPMALQALIGGLRAAGEDTRIRILVLLAEGELTVSDLTDILGQSQPRVSRHLKLMVEAGLIERSREGAWAFFRLADRTGPGHLARAMIGHIDPLDPIITLDRDRLADVRTQRAEAAQAFFSRHAAEWDRIRSLHAPEDVVEAQIMAMVGDRPVASLLDLGTGTGRMVALLGHLATRLVGVDQSHAMLAVARANLEQADIRGIEWRQGDLYALPVERHAFDLVILHQVLHFLDDPSRAIREAAQSLTPGGRLLVVDFAPHDLEFLRDTQAHRRLGFSAGQMIDWLSEAGLDIVAHKNIAPPKVDGGQLTVSLFMAQDPRRLMA
jgi:ArsR family transcriptional regulator